MPDGVKKVLCEGGMRTEEKRMKRGESVDVETRGIREGVWKD